MLHVGVQVYPLAGLDAQKVKELENAIVGNPTQLLGLQLPETPHVPAVQRAESPEAVYPELHDGVHDVPEADPATQFPPPPFVTVGKPAQGLGRHEPVATHDPAVQVSPNAGATDAVYPELHTGTQE